MTLTFHLYHDGIEIKPAPLYQKDLKAYAADSKRSLAARILRKRHRTRAGMAYYWSRITGRMTLPNSTVSLLVAGALFATHTIYV